MSGLPNFQFDTSIFTVPCDDIVTINGPGVWAENIQVDGYPLKDELSDFVHPVYFEVSGLAYHYVISVWHDRAEIEVRDNDDIKKLYSTMRPRNQSELLQALETVGADFEELHDFMMALVAA